MIFVVVVFNIRISSFPLCYRTPLFTYVYIITYMLMHKLLFYIMCKRLYENYGLCLFNFNLDGPLIWYHTGGIHTRKSSMVHFFYLRARHVVLWLFIWQFLAGGHFSQAGIINRYFSACKTRDSNCSWVRVLLTNVLLSRLRYLMFRVFLPFISQDI